MTAKLRVLIVTRLFPNAQEPVFATFNRQQFRALADICDVEIVASIPWFPGAPFFRRWTVAGRLSGVPRVETIDGLSVTHPRYLYLPKLWHGMTGALYAASLGAEMLGRRGRFDVLLGSWAFPDGVAAVALARLLGVPAVIKVHGSDMNVLAKIPSVARNLRWALPRARRVVAVSRPLTDVIASFGVRRDRIDIVPNGIDGDLFKPGDRAEARRELGHGGDRRRWLLYIGRLEPAKGVLDLVEAFRGLAARRDDLRLAIVGDGTARAACAAAAERLGDRIIVAGARPLEEMPRWLAACDVLALPSWNEGTPNVVLEALACGRRVVATRVGGVPDIVTSSDIGELVPPRDGAALADALARAADTPYEPAAVARAGATRSWAESAQGLEASLRAALS